MRSYFPKMVDFTKEEIDQTIEWISKKYKFLTPKDLDDIRFWSDPSSRWEGTIINDDPNAQFTCYPFDRNSDYFLKVYPASETEVITSEKKKPDDN